jgi:hypothetical protein
LAKIAAQQAATFHNVRDQREAVKKLAKSQLDNAKSLLENKRGAGHRIV